MNDRHPSGNSTPAAPAPEAPYAPGATYGEQTAQQGYAGYDGYSTGTFQNIGIAYSGYDTGHSGQWDTTGQWDTRAAYSGPYDTYAPTATYGTTDSYDTSAPYGDTGTYETTGQWGTTGQWPAADQWETGGHTQTWDTSLYAAHGLHEQQQTGQWSTTAWSGTGAYGASNATGSYEVYGTTGSYDTIGGAVGETDQWAEAEAETSIAAEAVPPAQPDTAPEPPAPERQSAEETSVLEPVVTDEAPDEAPAPLPGPRRDGGNRGRRRGASARSGYRTRRSALLTIAVPSVAAIGVAGIAAASVTGGGGDTKNTEASAPDPATVTPAAANSKLDTQLAGVSRDADDFADRASRTQQRLDLKARQAEEKKRKADEARRKEAERPKFVLPVKQKGLSAYFGQAGVNWMSVHTGIDFPVGLGTPVMAATDGTVRTQFNVAYGNMAMVTAPDGTETWYCHLSSNKIRSGTVKAGDVIAYSGKTGNSTGPHMHFEVRPGSGAAIDPLPWLRSHGLDPT
ncbi:peptidoglycan DD-metalloendopeptidase family protein [Streptomyces varsoviensis]|nr:peptidoglycan DD-metalloendopeptidase family protein [Streptomyces varsoviensis]